MARKQEDNSQNRVLFHQDVPEMPEGYYSGDKPNPNLQRFVETHLREKPYDPETDDYESPAFDTPIETTKATAIYNMHTYWSKKPHDAIRQYIQHYTEAGDLVLDPFCGSGGTALAALIDGRKAIAIDRSPAATFITKNYCTQVDRYDLLRAFEALKREVKPTMDALYGTRCDRCGGRADTAYTVYSQQFSCLRCNQLVRLFDCIEMDVVVTDRNGHPVTDQRTGKEKTKGILACPNCYLRGQVEEISTRSQRHGAVPVLVSYLCRSGCKPVRGERRHNDPDVKKKYYFETYDLAKIREIDEGRIPFWYPTDRMMHAPDDQERWGVKWRAGTSNFRSVDELYTKRNLWALAAIREGILRLDLDSRTRDALLFAFEGIVLINSRMCEAQNTQITKGTYYTPQIFKELYPLNSVETKVKTIAEASAEMRLASTSLAISTQSACHLESIPPNSIDYIFTDPPYAGKVQYGELNFVWEAWLAFDTGWHEEEIIVNEVRGTTESDWADMMRLAAAECYRVLRPGRWLSLCYHDTSEGTWALVQDLMAEVGFLVDRSDSVLFIDTEQKSFNQQTADKVNKRDLVINFRKPKPGEVLGGESITGDEDDGTFADKVHAVIRDYLIANPGSTKDRIYDEVVSRMVRAGQMEAHNFDELLSQIAEATSIEGSTNGKRWYLKETEITRVDAAESAKEDASAASVREFISSWLKTNPGFVGVHYSDVFEHYVYTVKDKPRRALADWLLDYFYKTDAGTYRLPESDEEERIKSEARASGTSRRIKHYIAHLQQGTAILDRDRPSDATLAEWIRHCKRSGLYEQGKLLFERGGLNLDNLSEEAMVNVEEDYQVCTRMLARSGK